MTMHKSRSSVERAVNQHIAVQNDAKREACLIFANPSSCWWQSPVHDWIFEGYPRYGAAIGTAYLFDRDVEQSSRAVKCGHSSSEKSPAI